MIIIGGAYSEEVAYPERLTPLAGSGVRAATLLQRSSPSLVTAVDDASVSQLAAVSAGWALPPTDLGRDIPVGFTYFSPVSTPTISGVGARLNSAVEVSDDDVLVFGMIETTPTRRVRAGRAVIDPQSPRGASDPTATAVDADTTLLSANAREIVADAGGTPTSLVDAARFVRQRDGHEAVIVRCGARGFLVADETGEVWSNATPTPQVWSLGTGDVFSAVLADTWFSGATPREAAAVASTCTAWWSSTKNPVIPEELLAGESIYSYFQSSPPGLFSAEALPRVYLAAPFFAIHERWLVETVKGVLEGLGTTVWSPFHEVGPGGNEVAEKDIAGLRECDVVLALLDGVDAGTVFETGWARAAGIPVVGYSTQVHSEANDACGAGRRAALGSHFSLVPDGLGGTRSTAATWPSRNARRRRPETRCRLDVNPPADRAVLLLSGGVDSAALAAWLRPALALFIDYGQLPAPAEAKASKAIARALNVPYRSASLPLGNFGGGLLLDGVPVAGAPSPEWWPYRNQFLATAGAAVALQSGLNRVVLGSVRGDGDRHVDGSAAFYSALDGVTSLQEGAVRVEAPALAFSTVELVRHAGISEAVLARTVSCHRAARPCGECPGCWKRQQVFAELGAFQPTVSTDG